MNNIENNKIRSDQQETAVSPQNDTEMQLAVLFNQGYEHLMSKRWKQAEAAFAKIETHNSHYEQSGMQASFLRRKAQYERIANNALDTGELEAALIAFKKADAFEQAREVHHLLTIQELEEKAEQATASGNYPEAAWTYDQLLNDYPQNEKVISWQIKRESCWEAELLPFFLLGVQALEKEQWRTAYQAFAQVLTVDPYFRKNGRSAAALSELARKEVVWQADQILRQGDVQKALTLYREVGHLGRIQNVAEFLHLRQREENLAETLEAAGKWSEAATKYSYLATLYYDEAEQMRWHEAVTRCQKQQRITTLHTQAMNAYTQKQWPEAASLFGQILALEPNIQIGEQPVRKLYRAARWRSFIRQFLPKTGPSTEINNRQPLA